MRRLMDEKGWTTDGLATATNLSQTLIARLSSGRPGTTVTRKTAWGTLDILCRVLMCEATDLMEDAS